MSAGHSLPTAAPAAATTAPDEAARLAALASLGFDPNRPERLRDAAHDRVVRLVRAMFGEGVEAALNLLDSRTQYTLAASSPPAWLAPGDACALLPRQDSLCTEALLQDGVMWVEDAAADPRFRDSPVVAGAPHLRFYAGAPVRLDGGALGALCALGPTPRAYDGELAAQLLELAALVGETFELRRSRDELRRAELERRAAENARDQLFILPVAIVVLDRDMRILRRSTQWTYDYEADARSPIGRTLYEVAEGSDVFAPVLERALRGEIVAGATPWRSHSGALLHKQYEVSPWIDVDGAVGGLTIISYDVTEQARARLAAECSEERLQLALDISDTVVWELKPATGEMFATGAAERLFGRAPDLEALAADVFAVAHPHDRRSVRAAWRRCRRSGGPCSVEFRVARADGVELWVAASTERRAATADAPERVLGVMRDITAIKRAQLEHQRAAEAADAANRAKSEFLANMSHELRTPLNGVMGVTGALSRTALDAGQRDMVGLIETSAHTLERLLSDVLDLARIEASSFDLAPEPVEMDAFMRGVATLFQWRARDKGLGFAWSAQPGLEGRRLADEVRLRQILSNLLSNAVKFTEAGRIDLLLAQGEGDEVVIEVSDTGIGFGEEAASRLFERFEQADGSITRRYGGTGLGLAISRSLAERMGGALTARSRPGEGSTFRLSLPLPRAPAAAPPAAQNTAPARAALCAPAPHAPPTAPVRAAAPAPRPASPTGPRVLLAEDHPVNRRVVELILDAAGVDLTSVENGEQALEALAVDRFDLVLMDMQMPVMDGLTAIRLLREREAAAGGARTPVVALTANAMPEHVAASAEAGADAHLSKPISAERLLAAVRTALTPAAQTDPGATAPRLAG